MFGVFYLGQAYFAEGNAINPAPANTNAAPTGLPGTVANVTPA